MTLEKYIKNYVDIEGFTIYREGIPMADIDRDSIPIRIVRRPCCSIGTYLLILESLKWKGIIRVKDEEDASE